MNPCVSSAELLGAIIPAEMATREARSLDAESRLRPDEERAVTGAISRRRRETFFDLWRENVRSVSLADEPKHLVSNFLNGVVSLPIAVTRK